MLIEKLIVRKTIPTIEVIREITFNLKGLSLIVDNTSEQVEDSGNNVGKTTAIKIIDLCLGAKSVKSLYYDSDTKSENVDIKEFLLENKVEAELILLQKKSSGYKKISIVRQLFDRGKRIIEDKEYKKDGFWEELKKILFDLKEPYPTLRQLIPKFVRVNDSTAESMIKFISNTSNDTYDTIYLFLFNILKNDLLSKKDILTIKLKSCEDKLKIYEKDSNISSLVSLKQREKLVNRELDDFLEKRKEFDYMETYKEELEKKRFLTVGINELEEIIELLDFDIKSIKKSVSKLINEKSYVDLIRLKHLYNEAKVYIHNLDKTYGEVVEFHNNMIQNRIDFIANQLDSKNSELERVIKERNLLLEQKKDLTIDMLDEGLLEELNMLSTKIQKLSVEKGEINQSLKILEGVENEKNDILTQIQDIDNKIDSGDITQKIGLFNQHFSEYCRKLYDEKFMFVYNDKWKLKKKFPVSLDSFRGNVGTGMKKGVIVAFDLAYMKFAEEMGIKAPQFVIHDKLENTHINQLKTIFDLCKEIDGQYIIPILRERIGKVDADLIENAKVLELSTDDKFFKIN